MMRFKEVFLKKRRDEKARTCLVTWEIQVEGLKNSDVSNCEIKTIDTKGFEGRAEMNDVNRELKVSVSADNILTLSYLINEFWNFDLKGSIEISISNSRTFEVEITHSFIDDPSNESDVIKPVKP